MKKYCFLLLAWLFFQYGYASEFPAGIISTNYDPASACVRVFIPPERQEADIENLWWFLEEHNSRQPIEHLLMQNFRTWEMTARDWEGLKKLEHLNALEIMSCRNFSLEKLCAIGRLENLKALHVLWTDITDEDFKFIENAAALEALTLHGSRVTDKGLASLKKFHSLKELRISKCPVTEEGMLPVLAEMKELERLSLNAEINSEPSSEDRGRYSNRILRPVSQMKNLKELKIFSEKFTPEGIPFLSQLKKLQIVEIPVCHNDESLKILCSLPEIQELNLSGDQTFTDEGLTELAKLPDLTVLCLNECPRLTNESISRLAALKRLTDLDISDNPQITNEAISSLARISSLERLDISRCGFTKKGVQKLKTLYIKKKQKVYITLQDQEELETMINKMGEEDGLER
ncbi:MAG: hypothetical protein Q4A17_15590 [Thermoguttaceae bacterium]|nr:hypothetical protein [Thermoguttaceae bacterium]